MTKKWFIFEIEGFQFCFLDVENNILYLHQSVIVFIRKTATLHYKIQTKKKKRPQNLFS